MSGRATDPTHRDRERVAVLLLRAWLEPRPEPALRVRVTRVNDLGGGQPESFVTADPAEVHAALDRWLEAFAGPSTR